MSYYYNRQAQHITLKEWVIAFEGEGRRVAETTLPNGRWVSTVWMGLDHSFCSGPPLIFETMVFTNQGDMRELDCRRYSTEADAVAGHARLVKKWKNKRAA